MPLRKQDYQNFKASCNQFLTAIEQPLQVSENDQDTFLNSAKTLVTSERFSFVVDLITFEVTHCLGVERWFGSSTKPFSMFDYLKIIHPNYVDRLMQMALSTLEVSGQYPGFLKFLDHRIIASLPIKEKNGRYWWVKRESTAFQFDARGRLTAYANLFTVVKEYNGESMAPRYSDRAGNSTDALYDVFVQRYRQRIREHLPFTKRPFEILKIYAQRSGWTSLHVGQKLAAILTYPQALSNRNKGGIVVIQFSLIDSNSIGKVKVFSDNQALNFDLIRQLTGKKLYPPEPSPLNNYTVKLHFKVTE